VSHRQPVDPLQADVVESGDRAARVAVQLVGVVDRLVTAVAGEQLVRALA
jgi:hypothetical protein